MNLRPIISAICLAFVATTSNALAQSSDSVPGPARPTNYRVEIDVRDQVDGKVVSSDKFTGVFTGTIRISRDRKTVGAVTIDSSAFEVAVRRFAGPSFPDVVHLEMSAQLRMRGNVAGPNDIGGELGQSVTSYIKLGTPFTVMDMGVDRAGQRKVTVQVAITIAPLE
jgi:hypothetical protein